MSNCVYMDTSSLVEIKRDKIVNEIENELGMSIPIEEIIPADLIQMIDMMKERVSSIQLEEHELKRKISLLKKLVALMNQCQSRRSTGRGRRKSKKNKSRHRKRHQKKRTKRR